MYIYQTYIIIQHPTSCELFSKISNLYYFTTPHKLWAIFSNISRHLWSHRSQQCFILMVFYVILSDQGCIIRCFISFDFGLHLYCAPRGFGISRAGDTFSILVKINYWNIHYFLAFSQRNEMNRALGHLCAHIVFTKKHRHNSNKMYLI